MATANIFERASRKALKFNFKGSIGTDDLWNLSRQDLNSIYIAIDKAIKETQGVGLLQTKTKISKDNDLRLEIVKYIYEYKTAKEENAKLAASIKLEVERLSNLLVSKREESDKGLSEADLLKKIQDLKGAGAVEEDD